MDAKHYFPEGDFQGMYLKVKIVVATRNLIFPKMIAKVLPWKLVKELIDYKHEILEGDCQCKYLKVTDCSGSCMLNMIFPKVIPKACPWT